MIFRTHIECSSLGSETWALRKTEEDLLGVLLRKCLWFFMGTRLNNNISNTRLCKECGSILLSRAIMRERLKWLGHVLRMKDAKLPKIVFVSQTSMAKRTRSSQNKMEGGGQHSTRTGF